MKKFLASFLMVTFLAACSSQKAVIRGGADSNLPDLEKHQSFFVGGIGQSKTINAAKVCGNASKVAMVETIEAPLDVISRIVTWGLYSPRTTKVYCR